LAPSQRDSRGRKLRREIFDPPPVRRHATKGFELRGALMPARIGQCADGTAL